MNWEGRKKEHFKCFMGIDKKTNIQYTNCDYCERMWAGEREMTKKEIEEYKKRPIEDFWW